MTIVIGDISISVDGYVTAPGVDAEHGLGVGGESLHTWVFEGDDTDRAVMAEAMERSGAVVMGRTLFDFIDGPTGWNDEMGYGADAAARPSFVVLTSTEPDAVRLDLDVRFCTGGPRAAVEQARDLAGDKDVVVMGGGRTIGSMLLEGLLDELWLHVSPVVLGGGTPLFRDGDRVDLEQLHVRPSTTASHVRYRVRRRGRPPAPTPC